MEKVITFREGHGNVQIPYSSICYFQSMNHKIMVYTIDGQNEFYGKLTEVEQEAPESFIRIHKSYLVNEAFISCFYYDSVMLKNNKKLPISRAYRSVIRGNIVQNSKNRI